MKRISEKSKEREGRGEGSGKDYKPYIKAREFNSIGTCSNFVDWKTGRHVELLSQVELGAYCTLRWDDSVEDINEQYPLNNEKVRAILHKKNIELKEKGFPVMKSPIINEAPMTTDLVVTYKDGTKKIYSVKYDKKTISQRDIEKLWLEKAYWNQQGSEWKLIDKNDINMTLVKNIMLVTEFYDKSRIFDEVSLIKHAIATKEIAIDLEHEILDFSNPAWYLAKIRGSDICG